MTSAVAVSAMFIAAAVIVGLAVVGGVAVLARIEHHFAIRARLKLLDETLSDRADGDWPAVPDNMKFSVHGREK